MNHSYRLALVVFSTLLSIFAPVSSEAEETVLVGVPLTHRLGAWGILDTAGGQQLPPHFSSLVSGEVATGNVDSKSFTVSVDTIHLSIRGWDGPKADRGLSRVELIDSNSREVLREAKPPQSTIKAVAVLWNVVKLKGRRVFIRLTDNDANPSHAWLGIDAIDAGNAFRVDFATLGTLDTWTSKDQTTTRLQANHHGIAYLKNANVFVPAGGSRFVEVGFTARRLFLFGMTNTIDVGTPLWHYPSEYTQRFWVGDRLGEVRVHYSDNSVEVFPLVIGDSIWWGNLFHRYPEPFLSNPAKARALQQGLRLFPAKPVPDGFRMAFIEPQPKPIRSVEIVDSPNKAGTPRILALTAEVAAGAKTSARAVALPNAEPTHEMLDFLETDALRPEGTDDVQDRLALVRNTIYTTDDNFPTAVSLVIPDDYIGPAVRFEGNIYADILTNVFYRNLSDMNEKADPSGMYRESTMRTAMYGGYNGFGTYVEGQGPYRGHVWARGVGREMQEFLAFGNLEKAIKCVDYCFRGARNWDVEKNPALQIDGHPIPPHWSRIVNLPGVGKHSGAFENDGHGLIMMLVYNVWRRHPDRDAWLRENWSDVQLAAEWIMWQFENPELSGATDVLMSDTEGVFMIGIGVRDGNGIYCDYPCMEGLRCFAEMAESIGKNESAVRWRDRFVKMREAIDRNYAWHDSTGEKRPSVWTLWGAAWAHQSSQLAPLILAADTRRLDPQGDDPAWRLLNEASYERLIAKWKGEGAGRFDDEFWYLPHERHVADTAEQHFPPFGSYAVSMGYGQGFVTQAALLLDRMDDAQTMLDWTARSIYNADFEPYIVPEGVEIHPDGKAWFRTGDLGNGFQQASIMKVFRILLGVDDTDPSLLRFTPRMPPDWTRMSIEKFPAWVASETGEVVRVDLGYELLRNKDGSMTLRVESDQTLPEMQVRLGPFAEVGNTTVRLNGKILPAITTVNPASRWITISVPSHSAFEVTTQ